VNQWIANKHGNSPLHSETTQAMFCSVVVRKSRISVVHNHTTALWPRYCAVCVSITEAWDLQTKQNNAVIAPVDSANHFSIRFISVLVLLWSCSHLMRSYTFMMIFCSTQFCYFLYHGNVTCILHKWISRRCAITRVRNPMGSFFFSIYLILATEIGPGG
jgi:hypothetical protein